MLVFGMGGIVEMYVGHIRVVYGRLVEVTALRYECRPSCQTMVGVS